MAIHTRFRRMAYAIVRVLGVVSAIFVGVVLMIFLCGCIWARIIWGLMPWLSGPIIVYLMVKYLT